tara:strand:- start:1782 stop:2171 length:390 start_codon:yes stop_codon:yes gene_type:complete
MPTNKENQTHMPENKVFTRDRIKSAQTKGLDYLIFWAPGCPYSEQAQASVPRLKKAGLKITAYKVGGPRGIQNRRAIEAAAEELRELLQTPSYRVTWPQILKIGPGAKIKVLGGGFQEFFNQKDVRDLI